ncbi:MAG: hypothetical protein ACMG57_01410 [Candidatus Dojkabacteria bacterium]
MDQIRFQPQVQSIIDSAKYSDSPEFIKGVTRVFEYLQSVNRIVQDGDEVVVDGGMDLFDVLQNLDLRDLHIYIILTERGSVYLWDETSSSSLRFKNDHNEYRVMRLSLHCKFEPSERYTDLGIQDSPKIGYHPREVFNDEKWHKGTEIIDVA